MKGAALLGHQTGVFGHELDHKLAIGRRIGRTHDSSGDCGRAIKPFAGVAGSTSAHSMTGPRCRRWAIPPPAAGPLFIQIPANHLAARAESAADLTSTLECASRFDRHHCSSSGAAMTRRQKGGQASKAPRCSASWVRLLCTDPGAAQCVGAALRSDLPRGGRKCTPPCPPDCKMQPRGWTYARARAMLSENQRGFSMAPALIFQQAQPRTPA